MKPIRLEIEGVKSFNQLQIIDFNKLMEGGVFGIVGPSGSGKSTILDAILIALYGKDSRSKTNADFINSKSKKARVLLEFEFKVNNKNTVFKVERVFFRSKKDPTIVSSEAQVFEKFGNGFNQVAESVYKTDAYIKNLLGMSDVEFSKCIALPQGEFAGFLKARPSERVSIIGNLFDLDVYGQKLSDKLSKKRSKIEENAKIVLAKLESMAEVSEEEIESLSDELNNIKEKIIEDDSKLLTLREEKSKFDKINKSKLRIDELNENLKEFEKNREEIDKKSEIIEKSIKFDKYSSIYKTREDLLKKVDSINLELNKDEKERIDLVNLYNEKKKVFDEFYGEVNNEIDELTKKYNYLLNLKSKLPRLDEINLMLDWTKKEIEEFVCKRNEIEEKIAKINEKILNFEKKAQKCNEKIESVSERANMYLSLSDIREYNKQIKLLEDFSKTLSDLREVKNREAMQAQKELFEISKKEKDLMKKSDEISNSVGAFLNDRTSNSYEKLRILDKKLNEILNSKSKIAFLRKYISAIDVENDEIVDAIKDLDDDAKKAQLKIEKAESIIHEIEKDIANERNERDSYFGANALSVILENVNIGEVCPICKSDILQKAYISRTDLGVFEKNIQDFERKKQNLENERDKILFVIAKIEIEKELKLSRIEFNKKKQKSLKNDIDEEYIKFVDLTDSKEEDFENLHKSVLSSIDKIELLIKMEEDLKDKINSIKDKRTELGTKIMLYREMAEEFISVYEIFEAERAERELYIYSIVGKQQTITESLDELRDDYLVYKKADEELKQIEQILKSLNDELTICKIDLSDNNNKYDRCNEKYMALLSEYNDINDEIKKQTYGDFDRYIESVKQKLNDKKLKLENDRIEILELDNKVAKKSGNIDNKIELREEYLRQIDEIDRSMASIHTELNIESVNDMSLYFISEDVRRNMRLEVDEFNSKIAIIKKELCELEKIDFSSYNEVVFYNINEKIKLYENSQNSLREKLGNLSLLIETKKNDFIKQKTLREEYKAIEGKLIKIKELADVLKNKALLEYVAEEYIDDITKIASKKLMSLKNGEYSLVCENREFYVIDNLDDGFKRSTSTLSGGETFVVSLALALAMSEAIIMSSNREFNFFFLDEGFGTLDSELCNTIVNALFNLHKQNLTIGLISHVKELQEMLNYKLVVKKRRENIGSTLDYEFTI